MTKNLIIRPVAGRLDTLAIVEFLDCRPDVIRDPFEQDVFLLCGTPSGVATQYRARCMRPDRFPYGVTIRVRDSVCQVDLSSADGASMRSALDVLRVIGTDNVSIHDDGSEVELAGDVSRHGVEVLVPTEVAVAQVSWHQVLIPVGFYADLPYGLPWEFSTMELPVDTGNGEAVAEYLSRGHVWKSTSIETWDVLDGQASDIGVLSYMTDGDYLWPSDLVYYVSKYHVRLPHAFGCHLRRRRYKMPSDVRTVPLLEGIVLE